MHNTGLLVCASLLVAIATSYSARKTVPTAMEDAGVIPDVIDKAPAQELQQIKSLNSWFIVIGYNGSFHVSYPDVPSRDEPEYREFNHWLVGNILGDKINNGEVLTEYVGAGPLNGTGLHRYVFVVFKQPGKINYTEPIVDKKYV
ncbi:OV-16 antigen [Blattella germanica]|nr:OV-16 antigen [Blattella germanica]